MSCEHVDRLSELALCGLPPQEARALQEHAAGCAECRAELASLRVVVGSFTAWPAGVLEPPGRLRARLASLIACEAGAEPAGVAPPPLTEPEWTTVAPGLSCKLLATDHERHLVSMLVRLAPNTHYPPHMHAAVEELHLLDGELWIDDRKLWAGDYHRAEPGAVDNRVWSETGCTCVLVTSARDVLRQDRRARGQRAVGLENRTQPPVSRKQREPRSMTRRVVRDAGLRRAWVSNPGVPLRW